ncbi:hypothetical protein H4W23_31675 [Streptomyces gardneri]|uniref:hypothetical protein n=1 Tax=Streptomyces gardneri TaxID=66892 RepID=UPI0006BD03A0|nr:hypothetical protein [Streptomyces gardneri]QPK48753.1 hypothetical protein H4W23_31675 [Streptomyces gardneri]WRK40233.1 hypothetical protein U0M97_31830 [Streptomyces venezuelae]CUM37539.1 hypothetical protein BN2537_4043 [Streptomyces venezuelae]
MNENFPTALPESDPGLFVALGPLDTDRYGTDPGLRPGGDAVECFIDFGEFGRLGAGVRNVNAEVAGTDG